MDDLVDAVCYYANQQALSQAVNFTVNQLVQAACDGARAEEERPCAQELNRSVSTSTIFNPHKQVSSAVALAFATAANGVCMFSRLSSHLLSL